MTAEEVAKEWDVYYNIHGEVQNNVLACMKQYANQPKWIPVSERLPTVEDANSCGAVLVQSKYNGFMVVDWEDIHDKDYMEFYGFVAWQKTPEPYKM